MRLLGNTADFDCSCLVCLVGPPSKCWVWMIKLTVLQSKLVGTYVYVRKFDFLGCLITPNFLRACPSIYVTGSVAEALPSAGDQVRSRMGYEDS